MTDPLPDKPVALVLGGVSPHVAVVRRMQALGFHTVLLDYKPDPPAAAVADRHLQVSTLDPEAVLAAARDLGARAVINVVLDQPLPVVAHVRRELGLPGGMSPETAHRLTNKDAMKRVLAAAGIPTAGWVVARDRAGLDLSGLRFPVVAKPVGGTGSLGVVFARDPAQLEAMLDTTFAHARQDGVLVEEFIEGTELSIDCIVTGGETHVLLARERHKTASPDGTEATCHATIAPAALDAPATAAMEAQARAIAAAFGITDGPMLIQAILEPGGRLVVLEVAGRLGGGPGASRVVELVTGFDYVGAAIDQQLGRPVTVRLQPRTGVYSANNLYASEGVFDRVSGLEEARAAGLIEEYYVYRSRGEAIPATISGRSRVTAFVVRAEDREGIRDRMARIAGMITIRDAGGRDLTRRDIGLHRSL